MVLSSYTFPINRHFCFLYYAVWYIHVNLIDHLIRNGHTSPLEMAEVQFHIKLPIFVMRQLVRHRTLNLNEMSARYEPLPNLNYLPSVDRLLHVDEKNKQAGSTGAVLTRADAIAERKALREEYKAAEESYQRALARGVPKELARIRLPVGRYSRMRATESPTRRAWK